MFEGINPAMFTPLTDDGGAISVERLKKLIPWLLNQGVTGLFVCGSTGEGVLLSPEERELVAEVTLTEVAGQVPVMVHVGAAATRDSVRLAKHAAKHGAAAVSSIPPFPFELSTRSVFGHWRQIGEATDLPMYIYYFPAMTGFTFGDDAVEQLLRLPNLVGLKFTDTDFYVLRNLIDLSGGRLHILSGPDQLCLPAQTMGARGAIGSTYNWMAPLFVDLLKAYRSGDWATATAKQASANAFIRIIHRYEKIAGQKVIMELLGVPCGPTREPIRPLDVAEAVQLRDELDAAGFAAVHG